MKRRAADAMGVGARGKQIEVGLMDAPDLAVDPVVLLDTDPAPIVLHLKQADRDIDEVVVVVEDEASDHGRGSLAAALRGVMPEA
jgi:hypothetical protein